MIQFLSNLAASCALTLLKLIAAIFNAALLLDLPFECSFLKMFKFERFHQNLQVFTEIVSDPDKMKGHSRGGTYKQNEKSCSLGNWSNCYHYYLKILRQDIDCQSRILKIHD